MKILMVCLGNICRSPLAHGILEHLAKREALDWEVDSAGTGSWHIGSAPDRRSIAVAKKYGIDISQQRCRQFKVSDFDSFDQIYVMDSQNLEDILSLARNETDKGRVALLLENDSIPDPYYNDAQFEPVFQLIDQACRLLLKNHKESK
ncbi:MAG: low molecular weight protein-tyrosine-phosphatase [Sphingobacteriaceae bacterium]|jgi:protein-tyrosine phosphatase|nr:MAG: low molecular weight phosphotyrosine protein phosphatase [Pedobacter sp.]